MEHRSLLNANTLTPTYTPDIDSDIVIIQATLEAESPCTTAVSFQITIEVFSAPSFLTFPDNDESCDTDPYLINGVSTEGNEQSVLWTTNGSGSFSNNTILNPTYIPSAADVVSGSVDLTLTLFADANCSPQLDVQNTFTLNLTPSPDINAGVDDNLCQGNTYTVTDATASNFNSLSWISNTGSGGHS